MLSDLLCPSLPRSLINITKELTYIIVFYKAASLLFLSSLEIDKWRHGFIVDGMGVQMSKEATLTDATDYIRKLQEEIRRLEEELRETLPEDENEENREEEEDEDKKMDVKGEVDVIPISRNGFYVKMVCMMSKCRGFSKVVETLGSIGGEMTNVSFNAMDGVCQIMFCLEVEENKRNLKVEKDDVKFLLEKMV